MCIRDRDKETDSIKHVKAVKVTGQKIKEDIYYTLIDGKVVEVTNEDRTND